MDPLMIWFIGTAVMTAVVLTVGTLRAAELLPRRRRPEAPVEERPATEQEAAATEDARAA